MGTAAVLAVYASGWLRTREAVAGSEGGRAGRQPRHREASANGAAGLEVSGLSRVAASQYPGANRAAVAPATSGGATAVETPVTPESTTHAAPSLATTNPPGPAMAAPAASNAGVPVGPPVAAASALPAPVPSAPVADTIRTDSAVTRAVVGWRDGTYAGWGSSRHGDIEATVVIEQGRIAAASISRCLTRYSCSWIAHLQPQVVARQSPEVDNVSGATESADAFYYAVVDALKKAK